MNIFKKFSLETQDAYGRYCNMCSKYKKEPVTYHHFQSMWTGRIKETFKNIHSDEINEGFI